MSLSIASNNQYQSNLTALLQRNTTSASVTSTDSSLLEADTSTNSDSTSSSIDASGISAFTNLLTMLSQNLTSGSDPDEQDDGGANSGLATTAVSGDMPSIPVATPLPGPTPVAGPTPLPGPTPITVGSSSVSTSSTVSSFSTQLGTDFQEIGGMLTDLGSELASTSGASTGLTSGTSVSSGNAASLNALIQALQNFGSQSPGVDPSSLFGA